MNVLHISNTDLMGRRFNGYDLIRELEPRGVACRQAVLNKASEDPRVIEILTTPEDTALHAACAAEERRRSMNNLLFPWGTVLTETEAFQEADVVHLHLIHNQVVSMFDVPRIVGLKPCVWTFHDPWVMTGHCIYPQECSKWLTGCRQCPRLDAIFPMAEDRADIMWKVKRKALADVDVDVVVASEFMLDMVRRSPVVSHLENVHLIPFGVDARMFLADEEKGSSRRALGIPEDDFVLLFRASSSEVKGLRYIVDALSATPPSRPTTLLTVDEAGMPPGLERDYRIVRLGWTDDEVLLARAFSACDALLMPSTAEAFGLMALEAMASGRPVICFEGTSLPSVTRAPECGVAVPMGDAVALRSAMDALAADPAEAARRGRLGREIVAEQSHDRYLDSLVALYERVLERPRRASQEHAPERGGALQGARICLVFEHNLKHYTRYRREIEALEEAGATVELLTSHADAEDAPPFMRVTVAPLRLDTVATGAASPERERALSGLAERMDAFWVSDYLSLPTVLKAAQEADVKVIYETVDLVPEYPHRGEEHRQRLLEGERAVIERIDGFITACDSYADYYVERYGGSGLARRPIVCDNSPDHVLGGITPAARPLRLVFFGQLMFDRPILELIRAVSGSSADVTLTFQGQNHLGSAPAELIEELGLQERVRLTDASPPEQIVEAAADYDVGVVALRGADENERRASTSKLFTYMAAGLAVLGSDLPGIARIINEHENGVLVSGMEPDAWAAALDRLAAMPISQIDAMKRRSLDAAKRYAWEEQKPRFIEVFVRALDGRGTSEAL